MTEPTRKLIQDWMIKNGADKLELDFDTNINHFSLICEYLFSASGKDILTSIFHGVEVLKRKDKTLIKAYGEYYLVINWESLQADNSFDKLVEHIKSN